MACFRRTRRLLSVLVVTGAPSIIWQDSNQSLMNANEEGVSSTSARDLEISSLGVAGGPLLFDFCGQHVM